MRRTPRDQFDAPAPDATLISSFVMARRSITSWPSTVELSSEALREYIDRRDREMPDASH